MNIRSLYMHIYQDIRHQITTNQLKPDDRLPTEAELTQRYDVSRITVKRALYELDKDGYIYRVRGSGSYAKGSNGNYAKTVPMLHNMIAFVLPSENSTGLSEYIRGASDELELRNYYLSIHTTNESITKEREFLEQLPKSRIQGIIFYPINATSNMDLAYSLFMNNYPIVTMDKYYEGLKIGHVVADNRSGGYMAAKKLLGLGHTRIAFVSSVSLESASSVKNRYFGYCQALIEHRIAIDARLVVLDYIHELGAVGETAFYERLVKGLAEAGVTAIQAENDNIAVKIMKAAADFGLKLPEQLSVVGFDNSEIAQLVDIPLTTVGQPFYQIGRTAAGLIVQAVESGAQPESRELPVEWVERGSIALKAQATNKSLSRGAEHEDRIELLQLAESVKSK